MKLFAAILGLSILFAVLAAFLFYRSRFGGPIQIASTGITVAAPTFYDLHFRSLEGEEIDFSRYRGRVVLVVNVASRCGLTPQYEDLEALHETFYDRGLTVLGFPSNDFRGQEPGDATEIRSFCSSTYGVSFPLFEKSAVTGPSKNVIYRFLCRELREPTWNFTKYLVDARGHVRYRFPPRTSPLDPRLRARIQELLPPAAVER